MTLPADRTASRPYAEGVETCRNVSKGGMAEWLAGWQP